MGLSEQRRWVAGGGEDCGHVADGIETLLGCRLENAGQDAVSLGTAFRLVAGAGLAEDHGGTHAPFAAIVRRFDPVVGQERKQMLAMLAQSLGEAAVVGVGEPAAFVDEGIELVFDGPEAAGKHRRCQGGLFVTESERLPQHGGHLAGKADRGPGLGGLHLLERFQEMGEALLVQPVGKGLVIVGQETIGHEHPFELPAEDIHDDFVAARFVDDVHRNGLAGEHPEPGGQRADPPAGLVRMHRATVADGHDQFVVDRQRLVRQPCVRLAQAARRDLEPKELPKNNLSVSLS